MMGMRRLFNLDISIELCLLPFRFNVMNPDEKLKWQHVTLEKVCGQIPKAVHDHFTNVAKSTRKELEDVARNQQIDALSIDVSYLPPTTLIPV